MKNVMMFVILFSCLNKIHSQNDIEIGASLSLVKFSKSNAVIIGDKHLFQIPSLNAT